MISYVCLRLIKYINDENVNTTLLGRVSDSSIDAHREALIKIKQDKTITTRKRSFYKDTFPRFLRSIVYRLVSDDRIKDIVEWRFLKMQLTDFIFSPSPAVTFSIKQAGIDSAKILETSYGMAPEDILDVSDKVYNSGPVHVLFFGRICLRKGATCCLNHGKNPRASCLNIS